MNIRHVIALLLLLLPAGLRAQDTLTLVFAGDVMQHKAQLDAARSGTAYRYDDYFHYVKPHLLPADMAIANLEVTLAGKPYSGYPQFCAPDELAVALREAGFDLLLTANNHSCDKGKHGIERTIQALDTLGIAHTGTFLSSDERSRNYPLITDCNNFRLALLNYTYGTNDIPTPAPTIVNRIDTAQIAADIAAARHAQADVVIANMHWGEEYKLHPNKEQKALADFLVRQGVPLIIGSHPHVLQPMECRTDSTGLPVHAVVYSLGNFISNMRAKNTDGGALVHITLVKQADGIRIAHCGYRLVWVYKPVIQNRRHYYLLPVAEFEHRPEFFPSPDDFRRMTEFAQHMRTLLDTDNSGFTEHKN